MNTKKELIDKLVEATNLPTASVRLVVEALPSVVNNAMMSDGAAVLPGIGKLKTATRAARTGRNPRTGETVNIPSKVAIKFSAAKDLEDIVNF